MRLLVVFALLVVSANAAKTFNQITAEVAGGHWNYGKEGEDWPHTCEEGKRQSPIDIVPDDAVKVTEGSSRAKKLQLVFKYASAKRPQMINNGHTIQINASKQKKLGFVRSGRSGTKYVIRQFHFHAPSEHTVNGKRYDAELHIVHQKKGSTGTDDLLVVGVFIKKGLHNKFLGSLEWEIAPNNKGSRTVDSEVDIRDLGKDVFDADYFAYAGSLTTPTCDETVSWRVLNTHVTATQRQIDVLVKKFKGNSRKTKPLNGRSVYLVRRKDDDDDDDDDF